MKTAKIRRGHGTVQRDIMTSDISVYSKALYALLASYTGSNETCYPSVKTICKNLKVSKNTIIKSVKELIENDLIVVSKKFNKDGGYDNNVYEPLQLLEEDTLVHEVNHPSSYGELPLVHEMNPKNNIIKNNIIRSFTFNDFWKMYPKKVGKDVSEKIFNKLPEKDLLEIKRTLPAFISNKPFATYNHPNPSTYLNQKRWHDEITDGIPNNQGEEEQGYTPKLLN